MLVTIANRRIAYDIAGADGAPVVCLLHTLSSDMGIWADQVAPLTAAGYRVLRIDMRGHGGSQVDEQDFTMADLARDVAGVLDHLGIAKVHMGGVSIGGMIGQSFALHYGDRLHSLLLSGTSAKAVPASQATWDARFAAGFAAHWPERWRQIHGTVSSTSPRGYVAGAMAIIDFDVLDRLGEVRVPTLVVCGDDDPGTPAEGNRLIASRIPGARYHEIADARHIPMADHPELYSRLLLEWIDANAG